MKHFHDVILPLDDLLTWKDAVELGEVGADA
jgi:hypothetical protein